MTAVTRVETGVADLVVELHEVPRWEVQHFVDCNMATAWVGDTFAVFPGKYGEDPEWAAAEGVQRGAGATVEEAFTLAPDEFRAVRMPPVAASGEPGLHGAVWFESVHQDPADDRRLWALYHNENYPVTLPFDAATGEGLDDRDWPPGLRGEGSAQAVPRIGVMTSRDGGESWTDLGIVLEDRDDRMIRLPVNRNFCFPGGVGDPCAVASGEHLYVFFGEYAYPGAWRAEEWDGEVEAAGQCVSVARIPLADLDRPGGTARRWDGQGFAAGGDEPGGPIHALRIPPAAGGGAVSQGGPRFYWGPSVSWNEDAEVWVMLLGCVDGPFWAGSSLYVSVNTSPDLGIGDAAQRWSTPVRLLHRPGSVVWYPSLQPTASDADRVGRRSSARLGARSRLFFKEFAGDVALEDSGPSSRYGSEFEVVLRRTGGGS